MRPPRLGEHPVAVFDIDLPTGIAFVRSFGRAGVPFIPYSASPNAAGRWSRYAGEVRRCPSVYDGDAFIEWLTEQFAGGAIDLVAPTSDYVSFGVAEALERAPGGTGVGTTPTAIRTCLFKEQFATAMEAVGFPVPPWELPTTLDEALDGAERLGYPVVLKPRSHAGVGVTRGVVAHDPDGMRAAFRAYPAGAGQRIALARNPDLVHPLLQTFHDPSTVDVVSLSGCLAPDGRVLALSHSKKSAQWPDGLGIGTTFVPIGEQPFTEAAVDAVRATLGQGIFELEVLVDRATGEHWAIDLNPRAFGQITLDIATGRDLPCLWYRSQHETVPAVAPPSEASGPAYWHHAIPVHLAALVAVVGGPRRVDALRNWVRRIRTPHVGATSDWRDPLPGLLFGWRFVRHPRALLRSVLRQRRATPAAASSAAGSDVTPGEVTAASSPPAR